MIHVSRFVLTALLASTATAQFNWSHRITGPDAGRVWTVREGANQMLWVAGHDGYGILAPYGVPLWSRTGGALWFDVAPTADGGAYLCGRTPDSSLDFAEAVVARVDSAGAVLWARAFPSDAAFSASAFHAVDVTPDGGVVAAGYLECDEDFWSSIVFRLDANGNHVWAAGRCAYDGASDVVALPDGGAVVVGMTFPSGFITRLGSDGNDLWTRDLDTSGRRLWVERSTTGDYLVSSGWSDLEFLQWETADRDPRVGTGSHLTRIDDAGNVIWSRKFAGGGADTGTAVQATADDGCLLVGETTSLGLADRDLRLTKLDAAGDIEWDRVYGGVQEEMAFSVDLTQNGSLLLAGRTFRAGGWQGWVLRTDATGALIGCATAELMVGATPFDPHAEVSGMAPYTLYTLEDHVLAPDPTSWDLIAECPSTDIGARRCAPATDNSTGAPAILWIKGTEEIESGAFVLAATQLPPGRFGMFLTGMGTGTQIPPGSQGTLCLGGATIHRLLDSLSSSGPAGTFGHVVDPTMIPGHGSVLPGETWGFQAWYRDKNPNTTSNLSDAVDLAFQ